MGALKLWVGGFILGRRAQSTRGGDYPTPTAVRAQQGLVFRDLQGAGRAGRNRLAYCGFTCSLLVNNKLSINGLEHGWETFNTVSRMGTYRGFIGHFHSSSS